MALNNLQPAAGSTKNTKRVGRGQGSGMGKDSFKREIKVKKLDLDIQLRDILKVVKCLFKKDFLKLDSFLE